MFWNKKDNNYNVLNDPLVKRIRLRTEADHREKEKQRWYWDEVVLMRIYFACAGLIVTCGCIVLSVILDQTGSGVLEWIDGFLLFDR